MAMSPAAFYNGPPGSVNHLAHQQNVDTSTPMPNQQQYQQQYCESQPLISNNGMMTQQGAGQQQFFQQQFEPQNQILQPPFQSCQIQTPQQQFHQPSAQTQTNAQLSYGFSKQLTQQNQNLVENMNGGQAQNKPAYGASQEPNSISNTGISKSGKKQDDDTEKEETKKCSGCCIAVAIICPLFVIAIVMVIVFTICCHADVESQRQKAEGNSKSGSNSTDADLINKSLSQSQAGQTKPQSNDKVDLTSKGTEQVKKSKKKEDNNGKDDKSKSESKNKNGNDGDTQSHTQSSKKEHKPKKDQDVNINKGFVADVKPYSGASEINQSFGDSTFGHEDNERAVKLDYELLKVLHGVIRNWVEKDKKQNNSTFLRNNKALFHKVMFDSNIRYQEKLIESLKPMDLFLEELSSALRTEVGHCGSKYQVVIQPIKLFHDAKLLEKDHAQSTKDEHWFWEFKDYQHLEISDVEDRQQILKVPESQYPDACQKIDFEKFPKGKTFDDGRIFKLPEVNYEEIQKVIQAESDDKGEADDDKDGNSTGKSDSENKTDNENKSNPKKTITKFSLFVCVPPSENQSKGRSMQISQELLWKALKRAIEEIHRLLTLELRYTDSVKENLTEKETQSQNQTDTFKNKYKVFVHDTHDLELGNKTDQYTCTPGRMIHKTDSYLNEEMEGDDPKLNKIKKSLNDFLSTTQMWKNFLVDLFKPDVEKGDEHCSQKQQNRQKQKKEKKQSDDNNDGDDEEEQNKDSDSKSQESDDDETDESDSDDTEDTDDTFSTKSHYRSGSLHSQQSSLKNQKRQVKSYKNKNKTVANMNFLSDLHKNHSRNEKQLQAYVNNIGSRSQKRGYTTNSVLTESDLSDVAKLNKETEDYARNVLKGRERYEKLGRKRQVLLAKIEALKRKKKTTYGY